MTLSQLFNVWLDSRRVVRAIDLKSFDLRLSVLEKDIKSLNQSLLLISRAVESSDQHKLLSEVNDLKAIVSKLSSRLIGFAKGGIS